jgi:hypothetical protein
MRFTFERHALDAKENCRMSTPTAKRTALITATVAIGCGFALFLWTGQAKSSKAVH